MFKNEKNTVIQLKNKLDKQKLQSIKCHFFNTRHLRQTSSFSVCNMYNKGYVAVSKLVYE